jgi:hypothetical protein
MNKGKARSDETKPNQENHRTLEFASIVVKDKPLEKAKYESKKSDPVTNMVSCKVELH